jgi:hypothetical protein
MKKVFKILVVGLFIALGSCSEDNEIKSIETNSIAKSKNLSEFFANNGVKPSYTNFIADKEVKISLPDGMNITVPFRALEDKNGIYTGNVKVYSRVLNSLADMVTSNYQTMDENGNMLTTGGSFELIFFDEKFNLLKIGENKKINIEFQADIKNTEMENMNFYKGKYEKSTKSDKKILKWSLTNENIIFNDNKYKFNYSENNNEFLKVNYDCWNPSCKCYDTFDCIEMRMNVNPMNNIDRINDLNTGNVPINLKVILGNASSNENIGIFIISPEYNSVISLVYDNSINAYTTETGQYPDLGNVIITAFQINNGVFSYDILNTNTSQEGFQLNLSEGIENEYYNILSNYIN